MNLERISNEDLERMYRMPGAFVHVYFRDTLADPQQIVETQVVDKNQILAEIRNRTGMILPKPAETGTLL